MTPASPLKAVSLFVIFAGSLTFSPSMADSRDTSDHYLSCSSDGSDTRIFCPIPVSANKIWLSEQYSQAPCVYGESWGLQDVYIWTSFGCAAEFGAEYDADLDAPVTTPLESPLEGRFLREA
ncbi:DUF3011 domain-containing protein [Parvularcula sp. IMCC14364]|uniref:DUF3011 domain-containing protein n=1 Tax=Parvularcula sp. IMCC14364 TaxID=3067902 RepID=UPI0027422A61|nr:DUF3011 domain-containing protein [Parvularcula sp. IMCC14364]